MVCVPEMFEKTMLVLGRARILPNFWRIQRNNYHVLWEVCVGSRWETG